MTLRLARKGFTLIEVLMVLSLIAIISVVSISKISDSIDEARFNTTLEKMNQIRNAILGNPEIREGSTRTNFGFVGDIGGLPRRLTDLIENPGYGGYTIDATTRITLGWNGPYLSSGSSGVNYEVDAWNTPLVFDDGSDPATLTSYGSDLASGTSGSSFTQDIIVNIPTEMRYSSISGFICQGAGPFDTDAEIELNYPDGDGNLSQAIVGVRAGDKGFFAFDTIPLGVRSITIYRPDKATADAAHTLGPILITIDKPNYVVPCDRIDIDP